MHSADPGTEGWIDGRTKGWPQDRPRTPLREVKDLGLSLLEDGLELPVAVLRQEVLEGNARWMREFLARAGASLCPHGKTTMAPRLFHRQLSDGAWGITLATPQQVRVAYESGIRRILLGNQLLEEGAIRWVQTTLDADPAFDFTCLVDSLPGVDVLSRIARGRRPVNVLLELGIPAGRAGARSLDDALAVAGAVRQAANLRLRGVECFEGILLGPDPATNEASVLAWMEDLAALARRCDAEDLFQGNEILLSAGGSAYFDLVVRVLGGVELGRPVRVLLRSGCYLSHDAGHYRRLVEALDERLPPEWRCEGHLESALEVWARVLSRPEPGLAFLNLGKRDVSHDLGLPRPLRWFRRGLHPQPVPAPEAWRITGLYDQHARLELPSQADLCPGDAIACAISHPCTTFDKWPVVYVVDGAWRVVDAYRTFF